MDIDILMLMALSKDRREIVVGRYARYALPDTVFRGRDLGDIGIEKMVYDDSPVGILTIAAHAEEDGADACIIDCFTDPGLEEASHKLNIPVIGVGQAGMLLAHAIRRRFAVITTEEAIARKIRENAMHYGLASNLHSVSAIDIPFDQVPKRVDEMLERLARVGKDLLSEVVTLVMGCTELAELSARFCEILKEHQPNVQVVNPLTAATRLAETIVLSGHGVPESGRRKTR